MRTVGYGSKKNFYRTFRKVVGLTPGAFRELPPGQAAAIRESVADVPSRRKPSIRLGKGGLRPGGDGVKRRD